MINIKAKVNPKSPLLGGWNPRKNDEPEDLSIDTVTGDMVKDKSRTPIKLKFMDYTSGRDNDTDRESFLRRRETMNGLIPKIGEKSVVSQVKQANQIAYISGKGMTGISNYTNAFA
jgi:hypothetical protein